jgi:hypothetical protein
MRAVGATGLDLPPRQRVVTCARDHDNRRREGGSPGPGTTGVVCQAFRDPHETSWGRCEARTRSFAVRRVSPVGGMSRVAFTGAMVAMARQDCHQREPTMRAIPRLRREPIVVQERGLTRARGVQRTGIGQMLQNCDCCRRRTAAADRPLVHPPRCRCWSRATARNATSGPAHNR